MQQTNNNVSPATIADILSEDFTIPDCIIDLSELIDNSIEAYYNLPMNRRETKAFKDKVNELIDTLNERRNMKLYNTLK